LFESGNVSGFNSIKATLQASGKPVVDPVKPDYASPFSFTFDLTSTLSETPRMKWYSTLMLPAFILLSGFSSEILAEYWDTI
jgi:hypothetical protein